MLIAANGALAESLVNVAAGLLTAAAFAIGAVAARRLRLGGLKLESIDAELDSDARQITAGGDVLIHIDSPAGQYGGSETPTASASEEAVDLLRKYHAETLSQSKISFLVSLLFASLGFVIIGSAVFSTQQDKAVGEQSRAWIALVASLIVESVSALFFVQARRAQDQLLGFFDRLRSDRRLEESLGLISSIEDDQLKGRIQASVALMLLSDSAPTSIAEVRLLVASDGSAAG